MPLPPGLRKLALTTHVVSSVGWLGTVIAYLALVAAALGSQDTRTMQAAWIAMELTGWYAIVPLALASLVTGLVMALGTQWGLFRHYWVLFKLGLTVFATTILLLHMPTVSVLAESATATDSPGAGGELLHAGGGLVVLVVTTVLSIYKPRGMTPYGERKHHEERDVPQP